MCDYSLMGIPNRLAKDGEALVSYKFLTGTKGFASPTDVANQEAAARPSGFREIVRVLFQGPVCDSVTAVCVPPSPRLILQATPGHLRRSHMIGATEEVKFIQLTSEANTHRDGLRFSNGLKISLQKLPEGLRPNSSASSWMGRRSRFPWKVSRCA